MAEPLRSLPFTYDDYLLLPEDSPQCELIEGELLMTPAPTVTHQTLLGRLFAAIFNFLATSPIGTVLFAPTDVVLSETTVVQPDLLFVAREHRNRIAEDGVHGPPDLVIEILSTGSSHRDEVIKPRLYAQHGIPEYWIVDPFHEVVRVFRLDGDRYRKVVELRANAGERLTSSLLPGLAIDLGEIFGH
ncbi:MAG: Uma2 family endonuclease [Acidobacteriota bacterium]